MDEDFLQCQWKLSAIRKKIRKLSIYSGTPYKTFKARRSIYFLKRRSITIL